MSDIVDIARVELRLLTREWTVLVFAFVFPVMLMLILAGVFGTHPSPEYGGVAPDDYYVADYVAVPLGALSLIGLPVMVATYRERGIFRRFHGAGVTTRSVVTAQAGVTAMLVLVGAATVWAVAAPVHGIPAVQRPFQVLLGFVSGGLVLLALGLVLGLASKNPRTAQALGLLAFFPMWLLGAGGPPRAVMPEVMQRVSDVLPLGRTAAAIREPWLATGSVVDDLAVLAVWSVVLVALFAVIGHRRHASTGRGS